MSDVKTQLSDLQAKATAAGASAVSHNKGWLGWVGALALLIVAVVVLVRVL